MKKLNIPNYFCYSLFFTLIKNSSLITIIFLVINLSTIQAEVFDGNLLFTPKPNGSQESVTSLMDIDFNIVNSWSSDCAVASMAYLLPDSTLIYPCAQDFPIFGEIAALGGRIIKYSWDGSILWDWQCDLGYQLHHDIQPLPNGNILAIALEEIESGIRADVILEIQPEGLHGAEIVWEWHTWDHRGSNDPYKFDDSLPFSLLDWNHFNAISINDLNRIYLSSRNWSEFYIIEWRSSGDILYRWGNPQNYGRGFANDRVLDSNHGVNEIPLGSPGKGNIIIFNNRSAQNSPGNLYSTVMEIAPDMNEDGTYFIEDFMPFGPTESIWEYDDDFYSGRQSGAFRLPNGNTIVTVAAESYVFEVTYEKEVVWEYICPSGNIQNSQKYGSDYFNILGDMNDDSIINILDIIQLSNIILGSDLPSEQDLILVDMNGDALLNVLDIIAIVGIILGN